MEKKCTYTPTPERGRRTPQCRQERRDGEREQTSENKENVALHDKDVDIFALPPPRTPVSSKKNARNNKNVLTTPNKNTNANGTKTSSVTPKGKKSLLFIRPLVAMKQGKCRLPVHRTVYLSTVIAFCSKQVLWSTGLCLIICISQLPLLHVARSHLSVPHSVLCSSHNHKCHIHMPHICK